MTFWVLVFIAEMLEVKGTLYFFDTFMEKRDGGYKIGRASCRERVYVLV